MPAWIHNRAKHIRSKNPEMSESQSFAIATQQAHKLGKTPKNYGTAEGKAVAKAKYRLPRKEYRKTADRVKKAAALVRMDKQANQGAMMQAASAGTPLAPSSTMAPKPPTMVQPAPAAKVAPVATPPLPTAQSGPGQMLNKTAMLDAFFDELVSIHDQLRREPR